MATPPRPARFSINDLQGMVDRYLERVERHSVRPVEEEVIDRGVHITVTTKYSDGAEIVWHVPPGRDPHNRANRMPLSISLPPLSAGPRPSLVITPTGTRISVSSADPAPPRQVRAEDRQPVAPPPVAPPVFPTAQELAGLQHAMTTCLTKLNVQVSRDPRVSPWCVAQSADTNFTVGSLAYQVLTRLRLAMEEAYAIEQRDLTARAAHVPRGVQRKMLFDDT